MTQQLNRRAFVEQLLLATAALSVSGCACSKIERKPLPPASERINVALIGAGGYGKQHVALWSAQKRAVITHVCDPDEARGREFVELVDKYQELAPKYEKDMRRVFENKDVDVVAIVTPHHWHAVAAIWAMQAGKDVYLEKPVSHNVVEGRRLIEAAHKYGRICQSGTHRRSDPNLAEAAAYIAAGKLGEPRVSRCITYKRRADIGAPGRFTAPSTVDVNLWTGPARGNSITRERFHYDWHWLWDYGNGALGNNGVHRIDLSRWLFQLKGLGDGVMSFGGRFGSPDAGETPNTQVTIQTFGKICVIQEVRGLPTEPYRKDCVNGVYFEGSEGVIVNVDSGTAAFDLNGNLTRKFDAALAKKEAHFANFLAVVDNRKTAELNCGIEEGHLSAALCHLANICHRVGKPASRAEISKSLSDLKVAGELGDTLSRTQRHLDENSVKAPMTLGVWIPIDSTQEAFVDHPQANSLLGRQYRKGFELPTLV